MMPIALMLVSMLTILSVVGVCQGYLLVKMDQQRAFSTMAQTESDNAIEIARRDIARQIAEHAEVADIQAPAAWTTARSLCNENETDCQSSIHSDTAFVKDTLLDMPRPMDTPMPCSTPSEYYRAETGISQCNLSLGGELNEERRVLQIRTTIQSRAGHTVASAERWIRFRVFRLAPYVQIVGVRDSHAGSSITSVADAGGFAGPKAANKDTLLRSYSPCRDVPESAPTPLSKDEYKWEEWTGSGPAPTVRATCRPDSGETSHYQNETRNDSVRKNSWGESM